MQVLEAMVNLPYIRFLAIRGFSIDRRTCIADRIFNEFNADWITTERMKGLTKHQVLAAHSVPIQRIENADDDEISNAANEALECFHTEAIPEVPFKLAAWKHLPRNVEDVIDIVQVTRRLEATLNTIIDTLACRSVQLCILKKELGHVECSSSPAQHPKDVQQALDYIYTRSPDFVPYFIKVLVQDLRVSTELRSFIKSNDDEGAVKYLKTYFPRVAKDVRVKLVDVDANVMIGTKAEFIRFLYVAEFEHVLEGEKHGVRKQWPYFFCVEGTNVDGSIGQSWKVQHKAGPLGKFSKK